MSIMMPWCELESDHDTDLVQLQKALKKEDYGGFAEMSVIEDRQHYQLRGRKKKLFRKNFVFHRRLRLAWMEILAEKETKFFWAAPSKGWYNLNVSGTKSGGYGAILFGEGGQVITAVAGVSEPVSTLYHQLLGVEKGLLSALKYIKGESSRVRIELSESYPVMVVRQCQRPLKSDSTVEVLDIIVRIEALMKKMYYCVIDTCPKETNRAADSLSMMILRSRLESFYPYEFNVSNLPKVMTDPRMDEFNVSNLPNEVTDIVQEDILRHIFFGRFD